MSLEGYQFDRYRIVRLLGGGGMGDVYLAEDARIGQQVALKVIRTEASPYLDPRAAQEALRLFHREAKAIAMLDHPHILPLYDYGEQHIGELNIIYLIMPYRQEGSLAKWVGQLDRHSRLLSPQEVAHIVLQAASALQHAHDHQIIHQDVKPSNFLIRTNKETSSLPDVFLSDFGIARLMTATSITSLSIRGTPTYMAPEQWQGKPVPASDQYALGVMAYELLTGHPPFQGAPGPIMYQHLTNPPTPPSTLNQLLSTEVDRELLQALAKKPEERFSSVTAFALTLQMNLLRLDTSVQTVQNIYASPIATSPSEIDSSTSNLASNETVIASNLPVNTIGTTIQTSYNFKTVKAQSSDSPSNANSPETLNSTPLPIDGKVIKTPRRLTTGKIILLIGVILLLLLGSGGLLHAILTNQAATNLSANENTLGNATTLALTATSVTSDSANSTGTAQSNATTLTYDANGTMTAATATSQAGVATAQANDSATARANAIATVQAHPSPPPQTRSPKILGGVTNLSGYCQSIGDSSASLDGNTAYSWSCVTPTGQHVGLSFRAACRWQYNDAQAVDRMVDYFSPYSWQCFTDAQKLGGVNLSGYCQSIGDSSASLDGNTAYSWSCVTPTGQHVGLSLRAACRWQFNDPQALDRMVDYFSPYSWECWG